MSGNEPPLHLVIIGRQPFGGRPPLGDWQLTRALARDHEILYVDPPIVARGSSLSELRRVIRPLITLASEGVSLLRPVALPGASRPRSAILSDLLVSRQIAAASSLTFSVKPVLITFDPLRGRLPGVSRELFVYWRKDRLGDLPRSRRGQWLRQRDEELLREADLVSCTATSLLHDARAHAGGEVVYIPNGCDVEHFQRNTATPRGFPAQRPVIGFIGGAFWRLDMALVSAIISMRPDWTFLFIGDASAELPDGANVRQVPYVGYSEIPGWMQRLDVGLIPYSMAQPFNHGSFPLKALEYLACGTPVVSTPLPALAGMEPHIRSASTPETFVQAVETALEVGPRGEESRRAVRGMDWADRADELVSQIRQRLP